MELPDITQAIALGGKTGQLVVALPSGRAPCSRPRTGRAREFFGLIGENGLRGRCWWRRTASANGNFAFNSARGGGGQRREDDSPGSQAALAERRR